MPLSLVYLLFVLMFFPAWLCLFLLRKRIRVEMCVFGFFNAAAGFALEWFIWTKDWVHSLTLFGTPAGIEDLILGFLLAGIALGFCRADYKKGLWIYTRVCLGETVCLLFVWVLGYFIPMRHSFHASIFGIGVVCVILFLIRRELIFDSILAGLGLAVVSIPAYLAAFAANPEFSQKYWQWQNLSGFVFLGIPVEDLIWFFFAGAFLAPLWTFWQDFYFRKRVSSEKPTCA